MKWLFATTEFPWPLNHGTWLRVYHLAGTLRREGDRVDLLCYEGTEQGMAEYAKIGVGVAKGLKGVRRHKGKSRCFLGPYVFDNRLANRLARQADQYDAVVLVRPDMLQYSREASAAGCVIADMVDDPNLEERRRLRQDGNPLDWFRRVRFLASEYHYERTFLGPVDWCIFVSPQDASHFARRHRRQKVASIPNGVDVAWFTRPGDMYYQTNSEPVMVFLGNMIHPPNADAAMFLLDQVAPLVWKQVPETQFVVVGSNPPDALVKKSGGRIEVTGWVEDVRPRLWTATAAVLAMRMGTGIKNKLLECWAAGTPVVATPLACQGVPTREGENLLLGTSAKELADQAVRLILDDQLRFQLSENGHKTVNSQLTWTSAAEAFRSIVSNSNKTDLEISGKTDDD